MRRACLVTTVLFAFGGGSAGAQIASPQPLPSAGITATPAPPVTAEPPRVSSVDGAFSLPGGVWNCETLANSTATSVYKLENPTTISERTKLMLPKHAPVELDSLFSFSRARNRWTVSLQDGKYVGVAGPWSTDTWTFEGTYVEGDEKRPVRLVYLSLGADAVRIDYRTPQGGSWRTFSGATCKRTIP